MSMLQFKLIIAVALAALLGGGLLYIKYANEKIDNLNTKLSVQEVTITTLSDNIDNIKVEMEKYYETVDKIKQENEVVQVKLASGRLKNLLEKKPVLVKKKINKAIKKVFEEFEQ